MWFDRLRNIWTIVTVVPSVRWHCCLGDRKGIQLVTKTGCWFVDGDDLTSYFTAPVVANTSIIRSSNKIRNGDILVPANPGPPWKWPLKRRDTMVLSCTVPEMCLYIAWELQIFVPHYFHLTLLLKVIPSEFCNNIHFITHKIRIMDQHGDEKCFMI